MCSHYEAPSPHQVAEAFGVAPFDQGRLDLWPGHLGPFLRSADGRAEDNESPEAMEVLTGSFGLIPSWSKDSKIARRTYNARSETVAEKPSFRHAWCHAQHCIIPDRAYTWNAQQTATQIIIGHLACQLFIHCLDLLIQIDEVIVQTLQQHRQTNGKFMLSQNNRQTLHDGQTSGQADAKFQ